MWNRYIQYSADKNTKLVRVLSHTNAVGLYINLTRFCKIHFNIILSSTSRYPKHFLVFIFFSLFSYEFLIQFQIPLKPVKWSFYLKKPPILVLKRWQYVVTMCIRTWERGTSHYFQKKRPITNYFKFYT